MSTRGTLTRTDTCDARNGTYVCQRPADHAGGHVAVYVVANVPHRALWVTENGEMRHVRMRLEDGAR